MQLLAEPTLGPDAEAVTHQKHADQQIRIDRRAAREAVEIRQMLPNAAEIFQPVNRTQQVVPRDVVFQ
ncbi:hypothetical protein LX70_01724 [Defluviimonas denitrificans]|uniref:Uncharacterized protein n=1 Tax=Albidovulum denitrificans TaxID=404881 RepID=A0A2S8SAU0_9RHOB|nr:hypothetical protein LX70_01724 [Defluviimonas denitrificans]